MKQHHVQNQLSRTRKAGYKSIDSQSKTRNRISKKAKQNKQKHTKGKKQRWANCNVIHKLTRSKSHKQDGQD